MEFSDEAERVSIDTTKPLEVPGAPPNACPKCGRGFSHLVKPPRRLQGKAKLVIGVGIVLSMVWGGMLWMLVRAIARAEGPVVIPINVITGAIALAVVAAPAYAIGVWAMRFPRVVRLACRNCGWQERYLVDAGGLIVDDGNR